MMIHKRLISIVVNPDRTTCNTWDETEERNTETP